MNRNEGEAMSDLISRSKEEWRAIQGYEGIYEVSNFGNVRSVDRYLDCKIKNVNKHLWKGRIISQQKRKDGRLTVALYSHSKRKRMLVHRVVADAFIPNPNNYPCINHKDENPANNKVENLEWCTYKYNNNYGTFAERRRKTMEEKGYWCGKKIKAVEQMGEDELRYCHHDDTDEYHDCLDYMECEECPYYYADLDQESD